MPLRLNMKLYTIGFTKKTAEKFFTLLKNNGIGCLVDIRLHPNGQLAGFARQTDLPYFLSSWQLATIATSHRLPRLTRYCLNTARTTTGAGTSSGSRP